MWKEREGSGCSDVAYTNPISQEAYSPCELFCWSQKAVWHELSGPVESRPLREEGSELHL